MDKLVFCIVHHSTNNLHKNIFAKCYSSIRTIYPDNKIIICKTSTSVIDIEISGDTEVINTIMDGTHIFGAMYLLNKRNDISNYIIIHDSIILMNKLPEHILERNFYGLWYFNSDHLDRCNIVIDLINKSNMSAFSKKRLIHIYYLYYNNIWRGLFGPSFGGNIQTLKFICEMINIEEINNFKGRDTLLAAERFIPLIASYLGCYNSMDDTNYICGNINNVYKVFMNINDDTDIHDRLVHSQNNFFTKLWVGRNTVPTVKKVAICLRGAVSKINGTFLNEDGVSYVNYKSCYNSIIKHIVNANPSIKFDFFIYSWNTDLKEELNNLYNPVRSEYVDNNIYKEEIEKYLKINNLPHNNYNIHSHFLSISNCVKMLNNYVNDTGDIYEMVILYRPDLILMKDMIITHYNSDKITVNGHPDLGGYFHIISSYDNILAFSELYNTTKYRNPVSYHHLHGKLKEFVIHYMNKEIVSDNIFPGQDQEVIRKIKEYSIGIHNIPIEVFEQYDLTRDEIDSYST